MPLVFSDLAPAQITGLWLFMNPGVEEIYRRWQHLLDWVPNDVFNAIKKDRAKASFGYDQEIRVGFLVYRIFLEEFTGKPYLHIWLTYVYPEFRHRLKEYIKDGMDFLEKTAKHYRCGYMEMDTMRKGWQRVLTESNMAPRRVVYRKEV